MRTRNLLLASLLASLLAALYGCQPETPVQQSAAPAAPAEPVAMTSMSAPLQAAEPAPVAQSTPAVSEKTAAGKQETGAAKPATPASVALPAKVEPAVPVTAAKPETKVAALSEAEGLALAKKSNCLTCHAIDKKVVGPAWKDVAAKYRGDAGAEDRLANVIAKGGRGAWGGMAMPANPQVSEADRRSLARFVLSLK